MSKKDKAIAGLALAALAEAALHQVVGKQARALGIPAGGVFLIGVVASAVIALA